MKLGAHAFGLALLLIFTLCNIPVSQAQSSATGSPAITRGKYLVEQVTQCRDCHTPHNEKGEPINSQSLRGASLTFKPIVPMPVWADKAPNIAGLRAKGNSALSHEITSSLLVTAGLQPVRNLLLIERLCVSSLSQSALEQRSCMSPEKGQVSRAFPASFSIQ